MVGRLTRIVLLGWVALAWGGPLSSQQAHGSTQWFDWTAPVGLERTAERLGADADQVLEEIHQRLDLGPPRRGRLVWVRDREGIASELGHPVPEWFAAVALPLEGRIVVAARIAGGEARLRATLRHELVHHAMGSLGEKAFLALPAWFHEGCAEYYSDEMYLGEMGVSLGWRAASGSLPPLAQFDDGFGRHPIQAAEGYALALAFVERLVRTSGPRAIPETLARVRAGETLDQALLEITGLPLVSHEELMRADLTSLRQLIRDFYPHLITFLFLGAVLLFPFVRRARRRRELELQQQWQRQEEGARLEQDGISRQGDAMAAWLDDSSSSPKER